MAYDNGLHSIVSLIDIFDKKSHKNVVKYLGKRYLKENKMSAMSGVDAVKSQLVSYLLTEEALFLQLQQETQEELEKSNKIDLSSEAYQMFKAVEKAKPESNFMYVFEENPEDTARKNSNQAGSDKDFKSISTNSLISNEIMETKINRVRGENELAQQIVNRINEAQLSSDLYSESDKNSPKFTQSPRSKSKMLNYDGYKINLMINDAAYNRNNAESVATTRATAKSKNMSRLSFNLQNEYEIRDILKTSDDSDSNGGDSKKRPETSFVNQVQTANQKFYANKPTTSSSTRSNPTNLTLMNSKIPKRIVSFKNDEKYYSTNEKLNSKDTSKFNNYYYLNSLSKREVAKPVIEECLKKYNEPLFPLQSRSSFTNSAANLNEKKTRILSSKERKILNEEQFPPVQDNLVFDPFRETTKTNKLTTRNQTAKNEFKYKTGNEVIETYLTSLKKSGLVNKNCFPIIRNSAQNSATQKTNLIRAKPSSKLKLII